MLEKGLLQLQDVPSEGSCLTIDILLVSFEGAHLFHGPNVIDLDEMVSRCSQQPVPILVPFCGHHSGLVGMATM